MSSSKNGKVRLPWIVCQLAILDRCEHPSLPQSPPHSSIHSGHLSDTWRHRIHWRNISSSPGHLDLAEHLPVGLSIVDKIIPWNYKTSSKSLGLGVHPITHTLRNPSGLEAKVKNMRRKRTRRVRPLSSFGGLYPHWKRRALWSQRAGGWDSASPVTAYMPFVTLIKFDVSQFLHLYKAPYSPHL